MEGQEVQDVDPAEKVLFLALGKKQKMNVLENRYQEATFLGMREESDEMYIGLDNGDVIKARA
eukprot:5319391-Heterocapsa_arctica.AAC.1